MLKSHSFADAHFTIENASSSSTPSKRKRQEDEGDNVDETPSKREQKKAKVDITLDAPDFYRREQKTLEQVGKGVASCYKSMVAALDLYKELENQVDVRKKNQKTKQKTKKKRTRWTCQ